MSGIISRSKEIVFYIEDQELLHKYITNISKNFQRIKITNGIFYEPEIKIRCKTLIKIFIDNDNNITSVFCKNEFCSYLQNTDNIRLVCFDCFKRRNFSIKICNETDYNNISVMLKKRYDTVFDILIKFVCKDVANEILEYSERRW
jgi:hypothetical protein